MVKISEFNPRRLYVQMMMRHKFFGQLMHNCNVIESDMIPTACIDKKLNIRMNKQFMESLTEDEQLFVYGHELLHGVFLHVFRIFEFIDPNHIPVGNIAADYLVNYILTEMGMKRPEMVKLYDIKYNPTDYTLESLVKELLKNNQQQQQGQQGSSGQGMDGNDISNEGGGDGEELTQEEKQKLERKLKSSLGAAIMQAKKQGNCPGSLLRISEQILGNKVHWRSELQDWFNTKVSGERNWSRPSKKFAFRGIYMPVNQTVGCGHIGVAGDLSGSIGQKEVDVWWSELRYMFQQCKPSKITICWFDTTKNVVVYDSIDDLPEKLEIPNMGGGTDFSVPINYFNDEVDDPITGLVFMTDMYGTWPEEPDYPMLILSTTPNNVAPYGKTVYCDMETQ